MKIGVVGLGLIGGSIFKKLSGLKEYEIIGVSRSVKGVDGVSPDYETLADCGLVFVCTPMNTVLEMLEKLETVLDSNTIVADVCSIKEFVSKKQYKFKFIPSHPMAGTEFSGWDNSFAELFKGAKWVVTPINGDISGLEKLEKVIYDLGAKVIITSSEEHDLAAALISHMPMLIAQALCENIKDNKLAQILASSGFKDTTRLALSNTEMAADIVDMNNTNIRKALNDLKNSLDILLEGGDYTSKIKKIKKFRQNLYD